MRLLFFVLNVFGSDVRPCLPLFDYSSTLYICFETLAEGIAISVAISVGLCYSSP